MAAPNATDFRALPPGGSPDAGGANPAQRGLSSNLEPGFYPGFFMGGGRASASENQKQAAAMPRRKRMVSVPFRPSAQPTMAAQNPQMAEQVQGVVANLAELDCDIVIDDAPDGLTPQLEQFQALVELKKMDANGELPFRAILTAMPNLKNKEQVLAMMDQGHQPSPEQQMAQQLQMRGAQAKVAETEANAMLKQAQAQAALRPEQAQAPDAGPTEAEQYETMMSAEQKQSAAVLNYARADESRVKAMLAPQQMRAQAQAARMKAQQPLAAQR